MWELFTDVFDYIPIGCIIENSIFCVHGGLSPSIETIEDIKELDLTNYLRIRLKK